jgi:hypothetical protein
VVADAGHDIAEVVEVVLVERGEQQPPDELDVAGHDLGDAGTAGGRDAKLAIRCAVILVDQRTGGKAGPEPLRTLATYRRAAQGGVKLSVTTPGTLTVGDNLIIDSWGDPEL